MMKSANSARETREGEGVSGLKKRVNLIELGDNDWG